MTPLSAANPRVKEARKLSRRSVRAERRLFLADGPKAVEGALGNGCVTEVFVTPAAARQYDALVAQAPQVCLVDDRALGSLSDSVTPAGIVAVCSFLDVPLASALD
ncbi:MAG: RNA methyltransferase substrate-binding domain-containing protein, partial [Nocardioides sp.]